MSKNHATNGGHQPIILMKGVVCSLELPMSDRELIGQLIKAFPPETSPAEPIVLSDDGLHYFEYNENGTVGVTDENGDVNIYTPVYSPEGKLVGYESEDQSIANAEENSFSCGNNPCLYTPNPPTAKKFAETAKEAQKTQEAQKAGSASKNRQTEKKKPSKSPNKLKDPSYVDLQKPANELHEAELQPTIEPSPQPVMFVGKKLEGAQNGPQLILNSTPVVFKIEIGGTYVFWNDEPIAVSTVVGTEDNVQAAHCSSASDISCGAAILYFSGIITSDGEAMAAAPEIRQFVAAQRGSIFTSQPEGLMSPLPMWMSDGRNVFADLRDSVDFDVLDAQVLRGGHSFAAHGDGKLLQRKPSIAVAAEISSGEGGTFTVFNGSLTQPMSRLETGGTQGNLFAHSDGSREIVANVRFDNPAQDQENPGGNDGGEDKDNSGQDEGRPDQHNRDGREHEDETPLA